MCATTWSHKDGEGDQRSVQQDAEQDAESDPRQEAAHAVRNARTIRVIAQKTTRIKASSAKAS
jgi:hypothetical protein